MSTTRIDLPDLTHEFRHHIDVEFNLYMVHTAPQFSLHVKAMAKLLVTQFGLSTAIHSAADHWHNWPLQCIERFLLAIATQDDAVRDSVQLSELAPLMCEFDLGEHNMETIKAIQWMWLSPTDMIAECALLLSIIHDTTGWWDELRDALPQFVSYYDSPAPNKEFYTDVMRIPVSDAPQDVRVFTGAIQLECIEDYIHVLAIAAHEVVCPTARQENSDD